MDGRRTSPSVARNRAPILRALRTVLPSDADVLEVGAGTGEHAVFFAGSEPGWQWQPTDRDPAALASITAWVRHAGLPNLRPPLVLDVAAPWPHRSLDAVFTANTIHYSPWETTPGLFAGSRGTLRTGGVLVLYGPFRFHGVLAPESNVQFEAWLKSQDPRFGVRDLQDLVALGSEHGLVHETTLEMPANNHLLVFRRS
ncbi:MAG: DUF938 domain-containing protein [Myxococcota bacterium]|nr:DUF938 domain-containing protein [Myxococcota bacterium]MEC8425622.1 DUF938 domain-containing protein [Myxococcota bacterium]